MKIKFLLLALVTAQIILAIAYYQYPKNDTQPPNLFQQNVAVSDLQKLGLTPVVEYEVVYSWEIKHIDGATTTVNLISFSTTTNVSAFYSVSEDSLNLRIYNYTSIKRYGEREKKVPVVNTSVVVHEIIHMTTLRNFPLCKTGWSLPECQERMAYDAGFIYELIASLDEDGLIKLSKN